MTFRFQAGVAALLLAIAPQGLNARQPDIVVEIAPAKIERRTFDPKNPPAEMPKLTPPEVGTCVYQFACASEAQAEGSRSRFASQPARVTEIRLRASLNIALWTPANGPAKILAHEEGHRELCEFYYHNAERIGWRLAQRALGTTLRSRTQLELKTELDVLQKTMIAEFLRETAMRCDFAQERFDAITEHSMNPIAENLAIVRSIAAEEASYAQRSPQRPAPAIAVESAATARRLPPTRPKR